MLFFEDTLIIPHLEFTQVSWSTVIHIFERINCSITKPVIFILNRAEIIIELGFSDVQLV